MNAQNKKKTIRNNKKSSIYPRATLIAMTYVITLLQGCTTTSSANKILGTSTSGYLGEVHGGPTRTPGFFMSPMTNDTLGKTDKLMTGSSSLHLKLPYFGNKNFISSAETSLYWRALTPSYRERDGAPNFPSPIGFYADWLEAQAALSMTYLTKVGGLKLSVGGGRGEIKEHGIGNIHKQIHQAVGQPFENIDYSSQKVGDTHSTDSSIGVVGPEISAGSFRLDSLISLGQRTNPFLYESYVSGSVYLQIYDGLSLLLERKIFKINRGRGYEFFRKIRYESTLVLGISGCYFPSIHYISPYLEHDHTGQLYTDILHWNFEF